MIKKNIKNNYTSFYLAKEHKKIYPTEFVVRIFLSKYPELSFIRPKPGDKILDIAFGDGRNTLFLNDLKLDVYGIEISEEIIMQTRKRLNELNCYPELIVGSNNSIPFQNKKFDYILASHCCYYCDKDDTIETNIKEYARVLKRKGTLIASIADKNSYIFKDSQPLKDGTSIIKNDPYESRVDYRLHGFDSRGDIKALFSKYFENFSFGESKNNYFGIDERVFWLVCNKK